VAIQIDVKGVVFLADIGFIQMIGWLGRKWRRKKININLYSSKYLSTDP
jgi:hypothetical protein